MCLALPAHARSRRSTLLALPAVAFAMVFAGMGCGHPESAADRHFARLRDGVGNVQADQDKQGDLALRDDNDDRGWTMLEPPPKTSATALGTPAPLQMPRTVQIGGDADADPNDDPNDPTARPEIRVQGSPGAPWRSGRSRPSPGKGGDIKIEPASPDDGARPSGPDSARPSILDPDAKRTYDHALSLVHSKQYDGALDELNAFMTRWPDHPYVENALYWRAEIAFVRGEHQRAAEQFEAVVARGGTKAPDALFKLGMCQERLGASDRAKDTWNRLRRDFPRSDAAKKLSKESR